MRLTPCFSSAVSLLLLALHVNLYASPLLDKIVSQGVAREVANLALTKYQQFKTRVQRHDNLAIIDFSLHSGRPRFFLIDLATGNVDKLHVAHGEGSDPADIGTPWRFSNTPDSHMSSIGSYIVAEIYQSKKFGRAARMDGLESSNNLARQRAIVLHGAKYVEESRSKMGMSWGCPAVSQLWIRQALARLAGGAFLYAYSPSETQVFDDHIVKQILADPTHVWSDESESSPVDGVGW